MYITKNSTHIHVYILNKPRSKSETGWMELVYMLVYESIYHQPCAAGKCETSGRQVGDNWETSRRQVGDRMD